MEYPIRFHGFPDMGIQGAAVATVISWIFVIIGMFILLLKDRLLNINLKETLSGFRNSAKEIARLGLPAIITQIATPLSLIYLTTLIAQQTSEAVAAFGVASRIQTLLMIGVLGLSTAITPFIAQNMGAHKQLRTNASIAFAGRASTYLGLIVSILLFLFVRPIAGIFSNDALVVDYTSMYFYIVSGSYIFYGLFVITSSIFNGMQLPSHSMKIVIVQAIGFIIPLTLLGSFFGVLGIYVGIALANILAGIYAAYEMRKQFMQSNSELASANIWQEYKRDFQRLFHAK